MSNAYEDAKQKFADDYTKFRDGRPSKDRSMTDFEKELNEILDVIIPRVGEIDGMTAQLRQKAINKAKARLLQLHEAEIKKARIDELKKMLMAEYPPSVFSDPTKILNEFLEKTPLIASYVLRDRLQELENQKGSDGNSST